MNIQPALDYIQTNPGTTFVELKQQFTKITGETADGDLVMELGPPNVVVWAGVNEQFVDFINEIQKSKQTQLKGTSVLVYAIDGGLLNLPIANRVPKKGYKKPHWAPVVFYAKDFDGER